MTPYYIVGFKIGSVWGKISSGSKEIGPCNDPDWLVYGWVEDTNNLGFWMF